jgi:hypothetical protein
LLVVMVTAAPEAVALIPATPLNAEASFLARSSAVIPLAEAALMVWLWPSTTTRSVVSSKLASLRVTPSAPLAVNRPPPLLCLAHHMIAALRVPGARDQMAEPPKPTRREAQHDQMTVGTQDAIDLAEHGMRRRRAFQRVR